MVRQTPNHGWDVPESEDQDYDETIDRLIDQIDQAVTIVGEINGRPEAGMTGRTFISVDEDEPTIYVDDGHEWHEVSGETILPDNLAFTDDAITLTGEWSFSQTLDTDISGTAAEAETADISNQAEEAKRLGGHSVDEYVRRSEDQEIDDDWTFNETVHFEEGIEVTGAVKLPIREDSDPIDPDPGEMWFRLDQQPVSNDN